MRENQHSLGKKYTQLPMLDTSAIETLHFVAIHIKLGL